MIVMPTAVDVPLRIDEGDVIRIGNTRVTLQAVIADFHRGASPEEITHHYSALNLSDVYLVVGYYLQNRVEVDAYVRRQRQLADEARQAYLADHPNDPLRERLLARLAEQRKQA
ncbi:MAG: DUF433 domain-containing protein [Chloroflexi bacterium]|nr:DUF433 domain-containing protein [Chloroflexota bacterium]